MTPINPGENNSIIKRAQDFLGQIGKTRQMLPSPGTRGITPAKSNGTNEGARAQAGRLHITDLSSPPVINLNGPHVEMRLTQQEIDALPVESMGAGIKNVLGLGSNRDRVQNMLEEYLGKAPRQNVKEN